MNDLTQIQSQLATIENRLAQIEAGSSDATVEEVVADLIAMYQTVASIKKLTSRMLDGPAKRIKHQLSEIIAETRQMKWDTDFGAAYVTAPSVSIKYDPRALDRMCAQNPDLNAMIRPFREERHRAGVLTIRGK